MAADFYSNPEAAPAEFLPVPSISISFFFLHQHFESWPTIGYANFEA